MKKQANNDTIIKKGGALMIKTTLCMDIGYTELKIKEKLTQNYPLSIEEIEDITILKSTLVVKDKIYYKLVVGVSVDAEKEKGLLKMRKVFSTAPEYNLEIPKSILKSRPVVIGAGPCGLFAALTLAIAGARPIVIERGERVEDRLLTVDKFIRNGALSTESNVQFGEGGAGTFSDGKLKYGAMDEFKHFVLTSFIEAGATEDIIYSDSAHLGTDKLPLIVANIRNKCISLGATFIYSARLVDINIRNERVNSIIYERCKERVELECESLVLAIGHSARDTIRYLFNKGFPIEARPFGVGMRIEHPREYINEIVYGKGYDKALPTASYHLVSHTENNRGVYSFCMCPGGVVVPATSEEGAVLTNGMSEYSRNADNSNSAILVSLSPSDFESDSPLAGIELQEKIERQAFSLSADYKAPSITLHELMTGEVSNNSYEVNPSFSLGTYHAHPDEYMPKIISASIRQAMPDFNSWLPGFALDTAVLTGPETRSTSPVRILRGEDYSIPTAKGVYPAGEGAGYSGGIISSATDGVKVALSILGEVAK